MLSEVHPKLPMRDKSVTRDFYLNKLGFTEFGHADYPDYLMVQKDMVQLHFFEFKTLDPKENYGQVYIRTNAIEHWFDIAQKQGLNHNLLEYKPWGQREFSILDPDNNLLTFGQSVD